MAQDLNNGQETEFEELLQDAEGIEDVADDESTDEESDDESTDEESDEESDDESTDEESDEESDDESTDEESGDESTDEELSEDDSAKAKIEAKRKKKQGKDDRRWGRLTAELKLQGETIQSLTKENSTLKAKPAAAQAAPATAAVEPNPADFNTVPEYFEAYNAHVKVQQEAILSGIDGGVTPVTVDKSAVTKEPTETDIRFKINVQKYAGKSKTFKQDYLDSEKFLGAASPETVAYLKNTAKGPQMLHKLARNPDLILSLRKKTGVAHTKAMIALESSVKGQKVTKAPTKQGVRKKKPAKITGSIKNPMKAAASLDNDAWNEYMNS